MPRTSVRLSDPAECPYLPGRVFVQEYFLAQGLNPQEWGELLDQGWRRFGTYFFRPRCPDCQACTPLRLPAQELHITPSLKKIQKKNSDVEFGYAPLEPTQELYDLYRDHGEFRFGESSDPEDFLKTFFPPGAPALLTTYRLNGELAAAGFLDVSDRGLSSVYFLYARKFASRSLGTWSVVRETQLVRDLGLRSYYLGYWVPGNDRMAYKHRFRSRELFDWKSEKWIRED